MTLSQIIMFIDLEILEKKQKYEQCLKIIGSLSHNFSESNIVYLSHRIAKQIFRNAFGLESLNDDNLVIDIKKERLGISLKTFEYCKNKTFQTIDKFNNEVYLYQHLSPLDLISKISELRNKKISFTSKDQNVIDLIYHCILRDIGKIKIFEESIDRIDLTNICIIKTENNCIVFEDGKHQYLFSLSKSILKKIFVAESILYEFDVEILTYPFEHLTNLFYKN